MGKEAACRATVGERAGHVKAHLDTTVLRLSGELRRTVPFAEISAVASHGGTLAFSSPTGEIAIELGEPLRSTVGARDPQSQITPGETRHRAVNGSAKSAATQILQPNSNAHSASPQPRTSGAPSTLLNFGRGAGGHRSNGLLARHLAPAGALWIIHAKRHAAVGPEGAVRDAIRELGLVDIKIVAFFGHPHGDEGHDPARHPTPTTLGADILCTLDNVPTRGSPHHRL